MGPVASHSLFLDIQEVTLLLEEYTLFAFACAHIFQQYLQHTYMCNTAHYLQTEPQCV